MMEIGSIHCALFVPMWINYDLKRTCTFKLTIFVKKKLFSLIRYMIMKMKQVAIMFCRRYVMLCTRCL